ncbi:MAG: amidohydrolase family protein [Myxococcota bacterium]|nr:amidohydrolase family protein [Myxococcota bacterium]
MPGRVLLTDALLLDPEADAPARGSLLLEGGRIAARLPAGTVAPEGVRSLSVAGLPVSPGLLDLHDHGDLVLRPAADAVLAMRQGSASKARHGVTGFLPTTLAWPGPELLERVGEIAQAIGGVGTAEASWPGAVPLGIHLEGPWIRAEAAGAQPARGIRPYDAVEGQALFERAAGAVRMVTLAPEIPGAEALLRELARRGVVSAIGHTLAGSEDVERAVGEGARHVTHLFNAMGPLHQRGPGAAAGLLAEERLSCDVIADGAHVHPAWLRIAARVKGEKLLLITDRIEPPAGMAVPLEDASLAWPGTASIHSDGIAWRLPDGRLAGSRLTLAEAIRNCVGWRVMTRLEAVRACTLAPARLLGIEARRGTLRPGARADLVLWSDAGEVLATWVGGRLVASAPVAPAAVTALAGG